MMFTVAEIAAMRRECNRLRLSGANLLDDYTDAELQMICNGIGAAWMPGWLIDLINAARPEAVLPSLIHDIRWHQAAGTRADFADSNRQFAANICAVSNDRYAWYNPQRYIGYARARRLRLELSVGGWPHYYACAEARLGGE